MKCLFQIANSELYSYSFAPIDSKMYIWLSDTQVMVIDPAINDEAMELLNKSNVEELIVILTHEHYDHISGVNWLRKSFKCTVMAIEECANNLGNPKKNASAHFTTLLSFSSQQIREQVIHVEPFICQADEIFQEPFYLEWGRHRIEIIKTPGHSEGSICLIVDNKYVFTGDSLIKDKPIITRLPGGSKKQYEEITYPFLKSLSSNMIIFPGHGEAGYLHEFKYLSKD
ncbi:MBL fold metallo-hydrolase [Lysinibacillus sp. FSL R7-0073]|uniref:MBL fold metallo-hydrolase n=1 Tax=Lysinibacillus TaxID=400634 RepID=UPI002E225685|nr:MBL fold metallo-hydrolase [Lysinibacillus fusiformis]